MNFREEAEVFTVSTESLCIKLSEGYNLDNTSTVEEYLLNNVAPAAFRKLIHLNNNVNVGQKGDEDRTPLIHKFFRNTKDQINLTIKSILDSIENQVKTAIIKDAQNHNYSEPQMQSIQDSFPKTNVIRKFVCESVFNCVMARIHHRQIKDEKQIKDFIKEFTPHLLWCSLQCSIANIESILPPCQTEDSASPEDRVIVPRQIAVPPELTNKITYEQIPKHDTSHEDIPDKVLVPILQHIITPLSSEDIRPARVWRVNNIRIINYAISLILYGRFHDHPDFPADLKIENPSESFPPVWFTVVDFFNRCNFPGISKKEIKKLNQEKKQSLPESLRLKINEEFEDIHFKVLSNGPYLFRSKTSRLEKLIATQTKPSQTAPKQSKPKNYLKYLDSALQLGSKRPALYNDLQDFIYKYRHQHQVGAFDEFPFLENASELDPSTSLLFMKASEDVENLNYFKKVALQGLHHNEISIMENVFCAKMFTRRPNSK